MQVLDEKPATQLYVDGDQLKTGELTAGTGYIKIPNAPMGKILEAKKSSSGTSWGAVYAQFMQPAAQIDNAASGLSITRQVIANGKSINDLKVGDKVKVRITIKASRDFDFVEVQDKRAACLEPVSQLSGYLQDYYIAPHDNATNYYFDCLARVHTSSKLNITSTARVNTTQARAPCNVLMHRNILVERRQRVSL